MLKADVFIRFATVLFVVNLSQITSIGRNAMSENNNNAVLGALMLVAGGMIGAGVALLFAPQSGERTRKDITRYTKKMRRKAEAVVDDFADTVSEMVETVSEKAEDILDKGKDMAYE